MLGTLVPFDAPYQIANNAPLPVGSTQSAQFYVQYPVESFTISLVFSGVANPGQDLSIAVQFSIDGQNWLNTPVLPVMQGNEYIGTVQCPAAMQFQVTALNSNPANTAATVTASALFPRSVA